MRVFPTVLLLVAFSAETATAFDKGARPFGVGVELGDPTGLSVKYYIKEQIAVEGGLGVYGWPGGVGLHVDLLYEFANVGDDNGEGVELPVFFGAGIKGGLLGCRYGFTHGADCDTEAFEGLRLPVGVAMHPKQTPFEVQLEVAPVIYTPFHDFDFGVEADFSLAVRYYY